MAWIVVGGVALVVVGAFGCLLLASFVDVDAQTYDEYPVIVPKDHP